MMTLVRRMMAPTGEPSASGVQMTGMQNMARMMWAPWVMMGFTIIVISLIIAVINASANVNDFFSLSKEARESTNSPVVGDLQSAETIKAWLPAFTFLGMGFLLGGITFALATILGTLRVAGGEVQHALGSQVRTPPAPMPANIFPVLMMMGMMVLAINLGLGIWLATVANDVFGNPLATIGGAAAGSDLLDDLRTVETTAAWLGTAAG